MHGGRGSGDDIGVYTCSISLAGHVAVCAASTACLRKSVRCSAHRGLRPEGITPLALIYPPHRRSWRRKRFRLIPASSGVSNPTRPRMLLLLMSARLLVVPISALALLLLFCVSILLPLLLLRGPTTLPLILLMLLLTGTTIRPTLLLRLLLSGYQLVAAASGAAAVRNHRCPAPPNCRC